MKKFLENITNIACNLFILIIIWFWFYFLLMLKLINIDLNNLLNYFGWNEADVALWNIRNILTPKFVIIIAIILLIWIWLFFRNFFTEKKSISKISLWIIIKSIIMIIIIKFSRFILWLITDYTTHLENKEWANIEYNTNLYK
jgi:hypothetical protein